MNRSRRVPITKSFVSGGVQQQFQQPNNQQVQQQGPQRVLQQVPQQASQRVLQQVAQQAPQRIQQQVQQQAPQRVQQHGQPQGTQYAQKPTPPSAILPDVKIKPVNEPPEKPLDPLVMDIKEETNTDADNLNSSMDDKLDTNGRPRFKKIFATRKKSSVRAKEKKIRQNRQLRKAILPKNALMALNEIKGVNISEFNVTHKDGGFTALMNVNGVQYEGKGISKVSAKNSACEKALRDFVLEKMIKHPRFPQHKADAVNEAMDTAESNDSDGAAAEHDDIPMLNLASFAIYKLFSEWENEGYDIPELHPSANTPENSNGSVNGDPKEPAKPTVRNELPDNWETMHPATLLCTMRPGISYIEHGAIGEKPNVLQKVSVIVDEQEFGACARSKKIARRDTAAAVCNALFGTNFAQGE